MNTFFLNVTKSNLQGRGYCRALCKRSQGDHEIQHRSGELKKHQIVYDFNQLLGRLVIKLNQQEVKRRIRLFNEPSEKPTCFKWKRSDWWCVSRKSATRFLNANAASISTSVSSDALRNPSCRDISEKESKE
jgi:hypothetical protein